MSSNFVTHEILMIGDQNVGKTSILKRLIEDKFEKKTFSSVGFNFKDIIHGNHKFCIWDSAGYMPTDKMGKIFLKEFDAVIIVFDVTNSESFKNLEKWLTRLNKNKNTIFYILGNKSESEGRKVKY